LKRFDKQCNINKNMSTLNRKIEIYQPFIYALLVAIGMFVGFTIANPDQKLVYQVEGEDFGNGIGRIEEVLRFIDSKYVDDLNIDELTEQALGHILGQLDPHSAYLSKDQLTSVNQQMNGKYIGLGIETIMDQDTLVVVKIVKDSPASKSKLAVFDRILRVNAADDDNSLVTYEEMAASLDGESGTQIILTIEKYDKSAIENVYVSLDEVITPTACVATLLNDSIAYVKIERFNSQVYKQFNFALEAIDKESMKHIIIDLRGNPGGYLPETAKILSLLFDEKDKMLVYTEDRNKRTSEYRTNGSKFYNIDEVAIIVDEHSASGSEILAGAIQDWDRGTIVGTSTYGKGLVQEQYNLKNGGALRLTIARYFTPSGRNIQKPYNHDMLQYDSVEYKTLVFDRPVEAMVGIVPDVLIDTPNDCPLVNNMSPLAMAYQIIERNELYSKETKTDIHQLDYISEISTNLQGVEKRPISFNLADPCIVEYQRKVKYAVHELLLDEPSAILATSRDDPFITESLNIKLSNN